MGLGGGGKKKKAPVAAPLGTTTNPTGQQGYSLTQNGKKSTLTTPTGTIRLGKKATQQAALADYQGALNQKAIDTQTSANRVNQVNPWGEVQWSQGADGNWKQTTTLTPAEQAALESQQRVKQGLSGTAEGMLGVVGDKYNKEMDWSGFTPQGQVATGPGMDQFKTYGEGPQLDANFQKIDPNQLAQMGQAGPAAQATWNRTGPAATSGVSQAALGQLGPQQVAQAQQAAYERAQLGNFTNTPGAEFVSGGEAAQFGGATTNAERAQEYDLQKNLDMSGLSAMPEASEAVRQQTIDAMYQQAMSRLQPQFDQQRQQALDRLYAMGGREGDPMFEQQKANLERTLTDANQQALWNAIGAGGQEQSRLFGLGMANRQQTWQEALGQGQFTNEALMNQFQQGAFNTGQANQVGMANAANQNQAGIASMQGKNQMNMFNAGEANQTNRFNTGLTSQENLARFGAENAMNQFNAGQFNQQGQFNAGQANQLGMFNAGQGNEMNLANFNAQNQLGMFNAGQGNQVGMFNAGQQNEQNRFDIGQGNQMGMFNAGQTNDMSRFNAGNQLQGMLGGLNYNLAAQNAGNTTQQQMFQNTMQGSDQWNQLLQQAYGNQRQNMTDTNAQRAQQIQEALMQRNQPLNELNALLGGQQVNAPQFGSYAQAGAADAADIYGGVMDMRAQRAAEQQAQNQMYAGLAQGAMGMFSFSDRRLKSNVTRIGTTPAGFGWYEYDIFGRREQGVMADEVPAEWTAIHPSGYMMVDYARVQ